MWQHVKLSDVSLGTRPRYSLVVDEDVEKNNNRALNVCCDNILNNAQLGIDSLLCVKPFKRQTGFIVLWEKI